MRFSTAFRALRAVQGEEVITHRMLADRLGYTMRRAGQTARQLSELGLLEDLGFPVDEDTGARSRCVVYRRTEQPLMSTPGYFPTSERDVGDRSLEENLQWRVVANAGRGRAALPRWRAVKMATGYGSTKARQLCVQVGFDPDDLVGALTPEEE